MTVPQSTRTRNVSFPLQRAKLFLSEGFGNGTVYACEETCLCLSQALSGLPNYGLSLCKIFNFSSRTVASK